jgi:hypothetical protein
MENVNLQLKDPAASFSDSGQTLNFREVLSFPRTEKVTAAIKTGLVRTVPATSILLAGDENLDKVQPTEVETLEVGEEKEVKPSKRK